MEPILQICRICDLYRREIGKAVHETSRYHPDYPSLLRCQRDVETGMVRLRDGTASERPEPVGFVKALTKADPTTCTWSLKQNRTQVQLVLVSGRILLTDQTGNHTILGRPIREVGIVPFGSRSILMREATSPGQLYSFELQQDRATMVGEYAARIPPWDGELRVVAFRVNMRMRFHAIGGLWKNDAPSLCLFGGKDDDFEPVAKTLRLNFTDGRPSWTQLQGPDQPPKRTRPAIVGTKHGVFLFGGKSPEGEALGDFFLYNRVWTPVAVVGKLRPPPGWGYDLVMEASGSLLLTGGNENFMFYRFVITEPSPLSGRWEAVKTSPSFAGLIGHRTFLLGDGYGIVVGGKKLDRTLNPDVLFFEEHGKKVSILACTGLAPLNRSGSTFGRIANFIFCFGGAAEDSCSVLDLVACHWSAVKGDWSQFRSASACTIRDVIYVHGGIGRDSRFQSALYTLALEAPDPRPTPTVEQLRKFAHKDPLLAPFCEWDWGVKSASRPQSSLAFWKRWAVHGHS
jgi:hypothetical protein